MEGEYNRDSDVVVHEAAHVAAYAQGVTIPAEFAAIDDAVRGDEAFAECVVEAILGHGAVYIAECPIELQKLALDLIAQ